MFIQINQKVSEGVFRALTNIYDSSFYRNELSMIRC